MAASTRDFRVTTDLHEIDLDTVHRWLSTDAFWALGRSRQTVQQAAEASMNFGVLDRERKLVGYARVVTDSATFAWLCDVYVSPGARGKGLGLFLATAVVETLRPLELNRVLLSTLDAHGLYERVGFTEFPDPQKLMILAPPKPKTWDA
ncbi:GNAT family N-acetyltransferase [Amnibacterium endophyticum]|uniref:GNAT family N-acetyltransferase n=1 Tax=Amnibacterium endophyticum TaxID=2109337 RepID=A0ABW4LEB3_9MICO